MHGAEFLGVLLDQYAEDLEEDVELLLALSVVLEGIVYFGKVEEEGDESLAERVGLVVGMRAELAETFDYALQSVAVALLGHQLGSDAAYSFHFFENAMGFAVAFLTHGQYKIVEKHISFFSLVEL